MMTEISLVDSLIVTVFSMIVVFAALVVIALIIGGIKLISSDNKKKETNEVRSEVKATKKEEIDLVQTKESDHELVAVIAAALAANLEVSAQEISIKTIRRVNQNATPWTIIGKQEQVFSGL